MGRDQFTSAIRAFRNRVAFQPFTVALANGDRYKVDQPDILAVGEGIALLIAPVFFDPEGVNQILGDLSGRGTEVS